MLLCAGVDTFSRWWRYPGYVAHLLGGEALHLQFPTRTIFEGVTVGINEGDRIGIVGRNGDGHPLKNSAGRELKVQRFAAK